MAESKLINKLAPDMTGRLSAEAQEALRSFHEARQLSPFATTDVACLRRDMVHDRSTLMRPAFVRDCEKIIHTPAYNRLNGKTQVFSFAANDDITRRNLHEQLVCRIARDIGRALGLNIDLIESIALGHDVGHTPFGHAGERFLNEVYREHTGRWFYHNVQSVRVLDVLYGRNLALQTLDGVLCHNGEFEQQVFETSGLLDFDTFDRVVEGCWQDGGEAIERLRPMTLEGCVVRVSDIIAYVGKDRQDAIRAGLVGEDSFEDGLGGAYNAWALSAFATDVVNASTGKDRIEMSAAGFSELKRAKRENYEKIYGSAEVNGDLPRAVGELFAMLYDYELKALEEGREEDPIFTAHIEPLQEQLGHYGKSYVWQDDLDPTVCDFISAMTDDYFVALTERLFAEARDLFPKRGYFDGASLTLE